MKIWGKYIKKYYKMFFLAVSFLCAEAACDLMQPTIMSKIVDVGVAHKDLNTVIKLGGTMLLITAIGAISACVRNVLSNKVSLRFGAELRLDMFKKIQSFSFENIDKFERASLITRLTNDVTILQNFVGGLMRIFVKAPLICIGSLFMASKLNPRLTWILFVVVPIVSILIILSMRVGYPFFNKVQTALDGVNAKIREYLSGVRVVKAFNRFDLEEQKFEKVNEDLTGVSIRANKVMAVFSPGISFTVNMGIVLVLIFGGFGVENGSVHTGEIIAFINYMTQILFSLMMISFVFNMFVRAKASSSRVAEVLIEENTMSDGEKEIGDSINKGTIEFKDVCYSYSDSQEEPVLKNISFKINSKETIGIIGATGSGKSTLINLIPRFYDSTKGEIKVDGMDVRDYKLKELREKIAVVPQKNVLFTGTVADNIKWGKEDASTSEVMDASRISMIHEFISKLPKGYDTVLGQGGVNFSGGQKQRVSIARALIKKPEILILDDSTSAVDVETEARIRSELSKREAKVTTVIIAQRITSVMNADRIIVLEDGQIAGFDSHEGLMKTCTIYRDIFQSQIGMEVV